MQKIALCLLALLLLTLFLLGVPQLAGTVADSFDYTDIDPDGAYAWVSVHHLVQALVFLVLIGLISGRRATDFGLVRGDAAVGKRYVVRFSLFFGIYVVGAYLSSVLTRSLQPFPYPLTGRNVLGQTAFQLFLSGPSEELIFRAFAITVLGTISRRRFFSGRISFANGIAAVIFGLAHVHFSLVPFNLSFSVFQLIYAFVLGLFYGDCYEKSGSVFYPMLMHSISNVLMVGTSIVLTYLLF